MAEIKCTAVATMDSLEGESAYREQASVSTKKRKDQQWRPVSWLYDKRSGAVISTSLTAATPNHP